MIYPSLPHRVWALLGARINRERRQKTETHFRFLFRGEPMTLRFSGPRSAKWRSRREGRVPPLPGVANNSHFIFLNVGWRIRP